MQATKGREEMTKGTEERKDEQTAKAVEGSRSTRTTGKTKMRSAKEVKNNASQLTLRSIPRRVGVQGCLYRSRGYPDTAK